MWSHIRANGYDYNPVPEEWLRRELGRFGDDHPLQLAGMFNGSAERAGEIADRYDADFRSWVHGQATAARPPGGGLMPLGEAWYSAVHGRIAAHRQ